MSTVTQLEPEVLKARIERFRQVQSEIVTQVRRVIVGQEEVLDQVMIALFVGGHCLITGLPAPEQGPNSAPAAVQATPEERLDIQERRIDEQAQTKVEASQRFPIRLTGMALFNTFLDSAQSGGVDYPTVAAAP